MLFTASTVMDTLEHVRRHVEGNLAGGVDHVVVFLDKPEAPGQAEVAAYLDAQPAATGVRAGEDWWAGERPDELNIRQCTNANLTKQVLADLGLSDSWLVHLDGDEVARVDRSALGALPRKAAAIKLAVREAVSRDVWPGEPDLFKRELVEADLQLLHGLGLLAEPTNQAYFRGHVMGKSGVRVGSDGWLTLHKIVREDGGVVPGTEHQSFELFHYESYSAAEFVRKWTSMVASGPMASYRPDRRGVARTLRQLIERGLEPAVLHEQLVRYHRLFIQEEADVLQGLGVLVRADPLAPVDGGAPRAAVPVQELATRLEAHRREPKGGFFHGSSPRRPQGDGTAAGAAAGTGRGRRGLRKPGRG
ncbi:MAG: hypothetical protein F2667_02585 [Actinobacteria bacterium]|uniref:Unannotated protein n=1 Tax=freshwater metagenome TaxID=449393 RepID=A0A6J6P797_9ZZZZ|nr:hypothetical protein [Actinomycetota bacterium]